MLTRHGTTINTSSTIYLVAKEAMPEARGKAVKIDESTGDAVLCSTAGEAAVGLIIVNGREDIEQNEEFSVQIKDIGVGVAGGDIKAGDYVSVKDDGTLEKCTSGFALGMATTSAQSGDFFSVQITKTGALTGGAAGAAAASTVDLSKATGTLSIDKGGTGATSASEALSALLESQPLSVENGGTGASDKDTAVTNLGAQKAE